MLRTVFIVGTILLTLNSLGNPEPGNASFMDFSVEMENELKLKIFPNPCQGEKIHIESESLKISEVRITDIGGKEVLVNKIRFPENKIQVILNGIPNGIYLTKIKTISNKIVVKKLIVSKK